MKLQSPKLVLNVLTSHFLPERVLKNRWLVLIIFITMLVSYTAYDTLALAQQMGAPANAWDVVVGVLNNRLSIHHGLTNLLIYLVSDIALFGELDQLILLRIGYRWLWFQIQAICTITAVIIYMALIVVIIFGVTVMTTPWSLAWSSAAMPIINQQGLPAEAFLTLPPLPTALFMLTLLGVAWIGIGVVVTTITMATQKAIFGFMAGLVLNYSTLIIWQADIRSPLLDKLWFHQRMFLWQNELMTDPFNRLFIQSMLYWLVWIAISLTALWSVCRNINIIAKDSN
ncbi:MAG: hypothetical protein HOP27_17395 [Anaerolineales bacterium]|jgi:hypothetical protein|nr:hypothetical protein [Anaerolineales bacterium]